MDLALNGHPRLLFVRHRFFRRRFCNPGCEQFHRISDVTYSAQKQCRKKGYGFVPLNVAKPRLEKSAAEIRTDDLGTLHTVDFSARNLLGFRAEKGMKSLRK